MQKSFGDFIWWVFTSARPLFDSNLETTRSRSAMADHVLGSVLKSEVIRGFSKDRKGIVSFQ